jgi:hypothetical protein
MPKLTSAFSYFNEQKHEISEAIDRISKEMNPISRPDRIEQTFQIDAELVMKSCEIVRRLSLDEDRTERGSLWNNSVIGDEEPPEEYEGFFKRAKQELKRHNN